VLDESHHGYGQLLIVVSLILGVDLDRADV
jgi:hypothetical protein